MPILIGILVIEIAHRAYVRHCVRVGIQRALPQIIQAARYYGIKP